MKRTEKDLHISSFHLNFAVKYKKKQLTNVATFRKNGSQKHRSNSPISTKICPESCRIAVSGVCPKFLYGFLASSDSACLSHS